LGNSSTAKNGGGQLTASLSGVKENPGYARLLKAKVEFYMSRELVKLIV